MICIVSDSPSLLEKAQQAGFAVSLLGVEDEQKSIKNLSWVLIVPHDLEGYDLSPYDYSFSLKGNDFSTLDTVLKSLQQLLALQDEKKKEEDQVQAYLRLLREASKHLQTATLEEKKRLMDLGKDFYHEFLPLLSLENSNHLLDSLKEFPSLKKLLKALYFHRGDQLPLLKEGDLLIPLSEKEGFYLHCELADPKLKGEGAVLVALLFHFVKDFLKLNGEIKISDEDHEGLWTEVLSQLETPYVLLGTDGSLLLHHQDFSRLGITPRECLQFKDGDKIEKQGQVYSISSQEFDERLLVSFRTEKKKVQNSLSNRELGVVSSSIAHELNNPLAGMLAAISLLFLEDLTEEENKALSDMKKSIERCKGLVEIFLGFSRMSPHQHIHGSLSQSFTQAMNLLRFRMVESNVRLMIDADHLENFEGKFNPSIMAMFFYIVLNELLTLGQKNLLLMETAKHKGSSLTGAVQAKAHYIELELNEKIDLSSLRNSRLLSHLADLLEMRLDFELGKVTIKKALS